MITQANLKAKDIIMITLVMFGILGTSTGIYNFIRTENYYCFLYFLTSIPSILGSYILWKTTVNSVTTAGLLNQDLANDGWATIALIITTLAVLFFIGIGLTVISLIVTRGNLFSLLWLILSASITLIWLGAKFSKSTKLNSNEK